MKYQDIKQEHILLFKVIFCCTQQRLVFFHLKINKKYLLYSFNDAIFISAIYIQGQTIRLPIYFKDNLIITVTHLHMDQDLQNFKICYFVLLFIILYYIFLEVIYLLVSAGP